MATNAQAIDPMPIQKGSQMLRLRANEPMAGLSNRSTLPTAWK